MPAHDFQRGAGIGGIKLDGANFLACRQADSPARPPASGALSSLSASVTDCTRSLRAMS